VAYAEILNGAPLARRAPGARHELICGRSTNGEAGVANFAGTRLLAPRAEVQLSAKHTLPDLALVAAATGDLARRRDCQFG